MSNYRNKRRAGCRDKPKTGPGPRLRVVRHKMDFKDLQSYSKALDKLNRDAPEVLLVSGTDPSIFDVVLEQVKKRLGKTVGDFETSVLSGESGDHLRMQEEIFNIPLFAPYRLIVIRQGSEVFKPILADKQAAAGFQDDFGRLPERTLLLIQFEGAAPKGLLNLFGKRLLHLITRDIFANQVMDVIRGAGKKHGVKLAEDAIYEIRERVEPRAGAIEMAVQRLKDILPADHGEVSGHDVREVLFPNPGFNPFELVDAIFGGDFRGFQRELLHYNSGADNLFVILKLMLNRADEIRRATQGRGLGMADVELIDFLGLKGRPPFVQKKILQRLSVEPREYDDQRLLNVYQLLITLQMDFRGQVPVSRQPLVFEERVRELFFA